MSGDLVATKYEPARTKHCGYLFFRKEVTKKLAKPNCFEKQQIKSRKGLPQCSVKTLMYLTKFTT